MEKGLITKRPNLTSSQKELYKTIITKIENSKPITFIESKEIYINFACRDVRDGVPYVWNNWWRNEKDEIVGRYQPLSDWELKNRVLLWLTSNIGCLVLKGYLKVIPQIEIKELADHN